MCACLMLGVGYGDETIRVGINTTNDNELNDGEIRFSDSPGATLSLSKANLLFRLRSLRGNTPLIRMR